MLPIGYYYFYVLTLVKTVTQRIQCGKKKKKQTHNYYHYKQLINYRETCDFYFSSLRKRVYTYNITISDITYVNIIVKCVIYDGFLENQRKAVFV